MTYFVINSFEFKELIKVLGECHFICRQYLAYNSGDLLLIEIDIPNRNYNIKPSYHASKYNYYSFGKGEDAVKHFRKLIAKYEKSLYRKFYGVTKLNKKLLLI